MAGGRKKTEPRDWIRELNQAAANEVDRGERKYWPVNLLGGERTKPVEVRSQAAPNARRGAED